MTSLTAEDLAALVPSWDLHLTAERKTPGTRKTYLDGVRPYLAWCAERGADPLRRASVQTWTSELLERTSPATAKTRVMAVRHFARWLAEEGEIPTNVFRDVKPPKTDMPAVPVLSDDELRALVKACAAPPGETSGLASLLHRRDEAMVRLLLETGMRATECVNLQVEDVDVQGGVVLIRRGKGGKGRRVPFGAQAGRALDRYLRVRRLHPRADLPDLWLGTRGRGPLAYGGLRFALVQRAEAAGITGFHVHMLRHTSADRWLAKGGSETGAMAVHGWSSLEMLQRYGRANRERRAADEARSLNLGDL